MSGRLPYIVSLFSGAGGLDHGFRLAGFPIKFALDKSSAAVATHGANFRGCKAIQADLGLSAAAHVASLVTSAIPPGSRIGVIGGPPCQGFSRANTNAQGDDPRNQLPHAYVETIRHLAKLYTVDFVVFENVLGIRDRRHRTTFDAIVASLESLALEITESELCALDYAVPQNRRRVVLVGVRDTVNTRLVFRRRKGPRTVRDAIYGLPDPVFFRRGLDPTDFPLHPNHWTMQPRSARFTTTNAATQAGRSFKRLDWDSPSPTVAFGHREILVHPSGTRRISIYEAMRLQGFGHDYVLSGNLSEQVELVSNAVPPPLARSIANAVKRTLAASSA